MSPGRRSMWTVVLNCTRKVQHMQYPHCGTDSPPDARFCIECGAPFTARCGSCGHENLLRAKFCAACGSPLATQPPPLVSGSKFQVQRSSGFVVRGPESDAEKCFKKAIEIAQRQQAKSLELRAVMSLARLWQQQDKKEKAQQMLAEIYGWFTEGFAPGGLKRG